MCLYHQKKGGFLLFVLTHGAHLFCTHLFFGLFLVSSLLSSSVHAFDIRLGEFITPLQCNFFFFFFPNATTLLLISKVKKKIQLGKTTSCRRRIQALINGGVVSS